MFTQSVVKRVIEKSKRLDLDPATVLAVAEVESAGRVYWSVGHKKMCAARFEGHYFYRRLHGKQREQAVALGLAHPSAGKVKNPRTFTGVYDLIERAAQIDRVAAYESSSWGLGQVMGAHWASLGFKSVFDLVDTCQSGADGQIDVMLRFIKHNNLIPVLQKNLWSNFAHRYNGPGYKKNRYDTKMAAAFKRWSRALNAGTIPGAAREGRKDFIREYQRDLNKLGFYKGKIDGQRGPQTRRAIQLFQRANGLKIDGIVGPLTTRTMNEQLVAMDKKKADQALGGGLGSSIGGGAVEGARTQIPETDKIDQAKEGVQQASDSLMSILWQTSSTILTVLVMILAFVACALTMYGLYLKFFKNSEVHTVEDDIETGYQAGM